MKYNKIPEIMFTHSQKAKLKRYAAKHGFHGLLATEECLYHQYHIKEISYTAIAKAVKTDAKKIKGYLVLMGVKIRTQGRKKVDIDPAELVKYLETHSVGQAMKKYGVVRSTIWLVWNKHLYPEDICNICGYPREAENHRSGVCNKCRREYGSQEQGNRCGV